MLTYWHSVDYESASDERQRSVSGIPHTSFSRGDTPTLEEDVMSGLLALHYFHPRHGKVALSPRSRKPIGKCSGAWIG
jgi:hypothetical protein